MTTRTRGRKIEEYRLQVLLNTSPQIVNYEQERLQETGSKKEDKS